MIGVETPDVDTALLGRGLHVLGAAGNTGQHRVEERVVDDVDPGAGQSSGHRLRVGMHPAGDRRQAGGAVVAGIHRGHDGQQDLGGADVAGGLVAADVLFAGLQRQPVRR